MRALRRSKREQAGKIEKPQPGLINLSGRTDTFKLVNFAGTKDMIGNFADVEITSSNTFSLVGRIKK